MNYILAEHIDLLPSAQRSPIPLAAALMKTFAATFLVCYGILTHGFALATDYYVDATAGNDHANGLSADSAWASIARVNSLTTLKHGDHILLKRGERWAEALIMPQSGIVISAYGEGDRPLLDGLVDTTQSGLEWGHAESLSAGTRKVWYLKSGAADFAHNIAALKQNNKLVRLAYRGNTLEAGRALKNHEYARINSTPDYGSWTFYVRVDEGMPSRTENSILLARDFETLIDTNNKRDLLIENIAIRGAVKSRSHSNPAILLRNAERVTIRNSSISFSKIAISTSSARLGPFYARDCVIEQNEIHDNAESGIYFRGPATNNIIRNNRIFNNYDKGLGDFIGDNLAIGFTGPDPAEDRSRNIVESNEIFSNGSYAWGDFNDDNAISLYTTSDTVVRFNKLRDNKQGAFYATIGSRNNSFTYNEVTGNEVRSWTRTSRNGKEKVYDGRLIFVLNSDNTRIINNTIAANVLQARHSSTAYYGMARLIGIEGKSRNTEFRNNIVTSNRLISMTGKPATLLLNWGRESIIDHNLYFDNVSLIVPEKKSALFFSPHSGTHKDLTSWKRTGHDRNSLYAPPMFIDPDTHQYGLLPGSAAIDHGAGPVPDYYDIQNNPIIGQPDIGAHEFSGID